MKIYYTTSISTTKITKSAQKLFLILAIIISFIISSQIKAKNEDKDELGPWSAMFYVGGTAKEVFIDAIMGKYTSYGETIYALELAYTLDKRNLFRRIFSPIFDTVEIAGNLAYRYDRTHSDKIKEANLYLIWRFSKFPWRSYLRTSVAIGDGISYASHQPYADLQENVPIEKHSRFLNFLMLEITFALPKYPNLELLLRTHHRCTAWGTFPGEANAGSTNVGVGIRYYF